MKVLLVNGSPRKEGNTALALKEMEKVLFILLILVIFLRSIFLF